MSATPPPIKGLTMGGLHEWDLRNARDPGPRLSATLGVQQLRGFLHDAFVEIDALRAELSTARASLEAFNSYAGVMGLLRSIVDEHYPAEVFDASSGDRGALMVAAARKLVEARGRIAEVEKERDAILLEARCWAGEAKCQRHTVNEVGSALGGIPDWGPIAATVRARLAQVTALRDALDHLAGLPCIQSYLHESRPCARGECGPCIAIKTLRKAAALAPAVTATPSEDVISHHATWEDGEFEPPSWVALRNLVAMIHEHESRGEAADFFLNEGCPDCTHGTVPDRSNTGRCAYHEACLLLKGEAS